MLFLDGLVAPGRTYGVSGWLQAFLFIVFYNMPFKKRHLLSISVNMHCFCLHLENIKWTRTAIQQFKSKNSNIVKSFNAKPIGDQHDVQ